MEPKSPSDRCLIEISVLGMHVRAIGPLAVLVAGGIFVFFLGFELLGEDTKVVFKTMLTS
jgi:hypothetical protein